MKHEPPNYCAHYFRRSLTGAWIETILRVLFAGTIRVAPLRGRGLKLSRGVSTEQINQCRSLTGAWIETLCLCILSSSRLCRSLTGAWIETPFHTSLSGRCTVAPLRGRGLKQPFCRSCAIVCCRSLTGAWIETVDFVVQVRHERRSLTGAWIETVCTPQHQSTHPVAPLRGRGLKLHIGLPRRSRQCRSLTGAWIETLNWAALEEEL